jgi:hypothetical protein
MKAYIVNGAAVVAIAASFVLLVGCSAAHTDAPDPAPANINAGTHQKIIQEPDGFRNVAFSCNGTTGIYVTSRGVSSDIITSGISTVANDPACK